MDQFVDRKFHILSLQGKPIGVDNCGDNCSVMPVITDGQIQDWSFKGGYLVLNDIYYCSYKGDQVIVSKNKQDAPKWVFKAADPGQWMITLFERPPRAWTAPPYLPKSPVILAREGSVSPGFQAFIIEEQRPRA